MKLNLATQPLLVRIFCLALLVACSLSAETSHALQLGKHRGAAVMGQPLNITVQATVDGPDDLAAGCLEADVFYADNRVQKSRVRISTEKSAASAQDVFIRIQSALAIDEPIVAVYLRAGCQQKIEKRYVVLADMLSEPAAGAPLLAPVAPSQGRSAAPVASSGPSTSATSINAAQARDARRVAREARLAESKARVAEAKLARNEQAAIQTPAVSDTPPAAVKSSPSVSKKPAAAGAKPQAAEKQKSRLTLEPLELLAERDPSLKASGELRSAPSTDPAQRAAAAALWRAIAAQPEDILNDSQKLKTLESAVSGLQLQMKQNQQSMQELGEGVKKAQAERFANPLIYGLAFLLFLAALGLVWLLRKRASAAKSDNAVQPWWRRSSNHRVGWADSAAGAKSGGMGRPPGSGGAYPPSSSGNAAQSASFLDLDLSQASGHPPSLSANSIQRNALAFKTAAGMHRGQSAQDSARKSYSGFASSASFSVRAVKAEELFDVQQQADFFVSLGQKDQAIEVLRLHIEESEQTSALIYLDLLSLYHQTKEELEFEAFRLEFNARFNAEMPAFDEYSQSTRSVGLQGYPTAMSRIVALWPSPKVVTVIEESLFRQADSQTPTFDLEAYRELLLLYAMIKDILHSQTSGKSKLEQPSTARTSVSGPVGFGGDHDFQADSGMERTQAFPGTAVVPLTATPDGDLGDVDIDLDLTSNSGNVFRSEKVEPAGAMLPLDSSVAIDMLQTGSTRYPGKSGAPSADGNVIDFDIEALGLPGKPTSKKAR